MCLFRSINPLIVWLPCKCRSDEERERDGTAALTAGAIGRGAAVPLPFIGGALSRNVRDADELAYQIAATVAFGLVQVRTGFFCFAEPSLQELVLIDCPALLDTQPPALVLTCKTCACTP